MGEAAAAQMRELPFYTNWTYAHPRAIELAAEVASLAPGDLNRVFFCSGGSEAVESAWKLARQYHAARGERRWKAVARRDRLPRDDHGRALDQRHRRAEDAVRAARPGHAPRPEHEPLPPSAGGDRGGVHGLPARRSRGGDPPGRSRHGRDGDHGAGPERRRLVRRARGLLAGRPRDLRPLRDPARRRRGDHRLRPARRLVRLGALRHPTRHRHVARRASPPRMRRSAP